MVDISSDKTLVERSGIPADTHVPDWFVKLIGLEPAGGDAIVSRGWEQAARVEVISHPMFALAGLARAHWAAWGGCWVVAWSAR